MDNLDLIPLSPADADLTSLPVLNPYAMLSGTIIMEIEDDEDLAYLDKTISVFDL